MNSLFSSLSEMMYASWFLAVIGSFFWGVLSIILSPCHLASIPLIIGYVGQNKKVTAFKSFKLSLLFSLGILLTIGLVGLITGISGRLLGDVGLIGNIIVSIIFFIVGLYFLDIVKLDFIGVSQSITKNKTGYFGALILGLIFGIGLGPCTFAFMAPIMGIVFNNAYNSVLVSILLIFSYAVGHCLLIVISGTAAGFSQRILNLNNNTKALKISKKIIGIIIIIAGIYWLIKSILHI